MRDICGARELFRVALALNPRHPALNTSSRRYSTRRGRIISERLSMQRPRVFEFPQPRVLEIREIRDQRTHLQTGQAVQKAQPPAIALNESQRAAEQHLQRARTPALPCHTAACTAAYR